MKRMKRQLLVPVLMLGFLLGIHEGRVALWRDGETAPYQVYDIRADTLPPADQVALRRGIRAENRDELWLILENYL